MKIILSNEAIQHTRSLKLIKRVFGPPIDALLYENPTKFGNWNVPVNNTQSVEDENDSDGNS